VARKPLDDVGSGCSHPAGRRAGAAQAPQRMRSARRSTVWHACARGAPQAGWRRREAPCLTSACGAAQGMSVGILGALALQEELAGRLAAARGDGAATAAALTGLAKVRACRPVPPSACLVKRLSGARGVPTCMKQCMQCGLDRVGCAGILKDAFCQGQLSLRPAAPRFLACTVLSSLWRAAVA